ncbi:MAG: hypothetical protein ABJA98_29975 [Acidobacteriota bacterium]
MMLTSILARASLVAALSSTLVAEPQRSASSPRSTKFAGVKKWSAEVTVISDCDGVAIDGSRTLIHNRIVTTYELTRRVSKAPGLRWSGKASTTYRWAVGTEFRGSRDLEESSGTFDVDAELELTDSTKLSIGRPPGRPFTRKKFAGEALLDSVTSDDMPPGAELYLAPLPADDGTSNGERAESAYSLLGGVVLNCPARRQWTLRAL